MTMMAWVETQLETKILVTKVANVQLKHYGRGSKDQCTQSLAVYRCMLCRGKNAVPLADIAYEVCLCIGACSARERMQSTALNASLTVLHQVQPSWMSHPAHLCHTRDQKLPACTGNIMAEGVRTNVRNYVQKALHDCRTRCWL